MASDLPPKRLPTFITLHIRLDRQNYSYWRSQVLATVKGHGFESVLLSNAVPEFNLTDTEAAMLWNRKDQFLLSWLLSSISESMLGYVNRCSHSYEVWKVLEDVFHSQSRARVMNLRFQLQTLKKGEMSIDDYILKTRTLADDLGAAGHYMKDEDLIMYLLGGLGPEFDAVVVNLTTRGDMLSLSEIQSILHTHEMRIMQYGSTQKALGAQAVAHYAAKDNKGNNNYNSYNKFKGKGKNYSKPRVQCQLCGKTNHVAAKCFKRFDTNFHGLENVPPISSNNSGSNSVLGAPPQAHFQAHLAHAFSGNSGSFTGLPKASSPHTHDAGMNPFANTIETNNSQVSSGSEWCVDSGATHHVTPHLANLQIHSPYQGTSSLVVGNGNSVGINNIGSSTVSSLQRGVNVSLNKVLHVPDVTRNILSISQFLKDNSAYIEFHTSFCVVKDLITHRVLLRGQLKDGLYQLDLSQVHGGSTKEEVERNDDRTGIARMENASSDRNLLAGTSKIHSGEERCIMGKITSVVENVEKGFDGHKARIVPTVGVDKSKDTDGNEDEKRNIEKQKKVCLSYSQDCIKCRKGGELQSCDSCFLRIHESCLGSDAYFEVDSNGKLYCPFCAFLRALSKETLRTKELTTFIRFKPLESKERSAKSLGVEGISLQPTNDLPKTCVEKASKQAGPSELRSNYSPPSGQKIVGSSSKRSAQSLDKDSQDGKRIRQMSKSTRVEPQEQTAALKTPNCRDETTSGKDSETSGSEKLANVRPKKGLLHETDLPREQKCPQSAQSSDAMESSVGSNSAKHFISVRNPKRQNLQQPGVSKMRRARIRWTTEEEEMLKISQHPESAGLEVSKRDLEPFLKYKRLNMPKYTLKQLKDSTLTGRHSISAALKEQSSLPVGNRAGCKTPVKDGNCNGIDKNDSISLPRDLPEAEELCTSYNNSERNEPFNEDNNGFISSKGHVDTDGVTDLCDEEQGKNQNVEETKDGNDGNMIGIARMENASSDRNLLAGTSKIHSGEERCIMGKTTSVVENVEKGFDGHKARIVPTVGVDKSKDTDGNEDEKSNIEKQKKMCLSYSQDCIKCRKGGELQSCSSDSCFLRIHESCLGSDAYFEVDSNGKLYCPFCAYLRAFSKSMEANEKASFKPLESKERSAKPLGVEGISLQPTNDLPKTCVEKASKQAGPSELRSNYSPPSGQKIVGSSSKRSAQSLDKDSQDGKRIRQMSKPTRVEPQEQTTALKTPNCRDETTSGKDSETSGSEKLADVRPKKGLLHETDLPREQKCPRSAQSSDAMESSEDSDAAKYFIRVRKPKSQTLQQPGVPKMRRARIRWTKEEEEKLKEGMRLFYSEDYPFIPWKTILEHGVGVFGKSRTPVDLKDKWKNMCANGGNPLGR